MPSDPFLLDSPAAVAFSGGRTSGLMTYRITQAHRACGAPLPFYVFCNTGKERPETLDFVEECSQRWAIPVVWLEYRWEPGRHLYVVVDHKSASRNGEPFECAIAARSQGETGRYLPNRISRYCTAELKVKTMWRWARDNGLAYYVKAVGLRWDEPGRVQKLLQGNGEVVLEPGPLLPFGEPGEATAQRQRPAHEYRASEEKVCPLFDAKLTLNDVMEFWKGQPFDLKLAPHEGNCDLCFLKRKGSILEIMRSRPDLAEWWIKQEAAGARFRSSKDRPRYELLLADAKQPTLFDDDEDDIPCACTD